MFRADTNSKKNVDFTYSSLYARPITVVKLGSHRDDKLHRLSSSPETDVVGTIKGWWSNFIAGDEQGDEYQKVLIFIAQVLCPTRELSFMTEMIMSKKMERWSMLKVILVYISITRNHIFICFQNCYEKKCAKAKYLKS